VVLGTKLISCALVVVHGEMEEESPSLIFVVDKEEVIIRIQFPDKFPTGCNTQCLSPDNFALTFIKDD
jgi:hypothetical protein